MAKPVFIVDANYYLHRSWFRHLDAELAVDTTLDMLERFSGDNRATAYVFDGHYSDKYRKEIYPEYKANRSAKPKELYVVRDAVVDIMQDEGYRVYYVNDWEGDDVVATLARISSEAGRETFIPSVDKDMLQCIRHNVSVLHPFKKQAGGSAVIGLAEFRDTYGFEPELWPHAQALAGDSADNVPGIQGIGLSGAISLVAEFGDINAIWDTPEDRLPKRYQPIIHGENRKDNWATAVLSLALVKLHDQVPLN